LKVGRAIDSAWEKQLLNYLRATEIEVGMLFNFGPKAEFKRYIFDNDKKRSHTSAQVPEMEKLK
jgi:hypothetical protein